MTHFLEEYDYLFLDIDPNKSGSFVTHNSNRWLNISKYNAVTLILFRTTAGDSLLQFRVRGSASATGASATTIATTSSDSAVGPLISSATITTAFQANVGRHVIDLTADEIAAVDPDAKYISIETAHSTTGAGGADEFGCIVIGKKRYPKVAGSSFTTGDA